MAKWRIWPGRDRNVQWLVPDPQVPGLSIMSWKMQEGTRSRAIPCKCRWCWHWSSGSQHLTWKTSLHPLPWVRYDLKGHYPLAAQLLEHLYKRENRNTVPECPLWAVLCSGVWSLLWSHAEATSTFLAGEYNSAPGICKKQQQQKNLEKKVYSNYISKKCD